MNRQLVGISCDRRNCHSPSCFIVRNSRAYPSGFRRHRIQKTNPEQLAFDTGTLVISLSLKNQPHTFQMADQAKRRTRPCAYYQQGKCNRVPCNFSHDIGGMNSNGSNGPFESSVSSSQTPSIVTPPNASQASSDDSHHYPDRKSVV